MSTVDHLLQVASDHLRGGAIMGKFLVFSLSALCRLPLLAASP